MALLCPCFISPQLRCIITIKVHKVKRNQMFIFGTFVYLMSYVQLCIFFTLTSWGLLIDVSIFLMKEEDNGPTRMQRVLKKFIISQVLSMEYPLSLRILRIDSSLAIYLHPLSPLSGRSQTSQNWTNAQFAIQLETFFEAKNGCTNCVLRKQIPNGSKVHTLQHNVQGKIYPYRSVSLPICPFHIPYDPWLIGQITLHVALTSSFNPADSLYLLYLHYF